MKSLLGFFWKKYYLTSRGFQNLWWQLELHILFAVHDQMTLKMKPLPYRLRWHLWDHVQPKSIKKCVFVFILIKKCQFCIQRCHFVTHKSVKPTKKQNLFESLTTFHSRHFLFKEIVNSVSRDMVISGVSLTGHESDLKTP